MTNDATQPTPEHQLLDAFVGTWKTEGRIHGDSGSDLELTGTDRYEWLPGRFFLVHHVDVRLGDQPIQSIEVIGYDPSTRSYPMHSFDSRGSTTDMQATVQDGTWRFTGETMRFTGGFAEDGNVIRGTWDQAKDDGTWRPWMDVILTRQ